MLKRIDQKQFNRLSTFTNLTWHKWFLKYLKLFRDWAKQCLRRVDTNFSLRETRVQAKYVVNGVTNRAGSSVPSLFFDC